MFASEYGINKYAASLRLYTCKRTYCIEEWIIHVSFICVDKGALCNSFTATEEQILQDLKTPSIELVPVCVFLNDYSFAFRIAHRLI